VQNCIVGYGVREGGQSVQVTVTRGGDTSGAAIVNYSTSNGTASDRSDYTAALGTLHFSAGEITKSFPVFITDDSLAEPAETFAVALNTMGAQPSSRPRRQRSPSKTTTTRAQALREIAENQEFQRRHFSRAFVLMQYFGYLRRNPNDTPDADFSGYNFWLGKLNQFGGNFINAEMVKAFISSTEYRQRFGQ
jgi:hypothetical protein